MIKKAVFVIFIGLILHSCFNIFPLSLTLHKISSFLPYLGIFLCFALSAAGTSKGLSSISSSVAGASILAPRIGSKSIIGTVFCEANFLYGIITAMMLYLQIPNKMDDAFVEKGSIIFACGLIVGICCYFSSNSIGSVCGAIAIMDAKDPTLFTKLVAMELISSSIGLLGLVIGFVIREKLGSLNV
ncbi:V-type proton ATPase subunit c'' [Binucleata daphniae]